MMKKTIGLIPLFCRGMKIRSFKKTNYTTMLISIMCIGFIPLTVCAQDDLAVAKYDSRHIASVWHWGSKTEPMGINYVVNDTNKAAIVIASYKKNNITRVYGGYSRMPCSLAERENLKRWNKSLYNNNIKSISLIGTSEWIFPEYRKEMLKFILDNYILFNRSADSTEQLCGIHLDIEVHGLAEWGTASLDRKRELMGMLKDTYKAARQLLVTYGMANDEIMADIPFWYDELLAVGWTSEEDRLSWFADAAKYIQGFTIMNYGNSSVPILLERAAWERANFTGVIEIGLNFEGVGTIWINRAQLCDALALIIASTNSPVAIHRYAFVLNKPGIPLIQSVKLIYLERLSPALAKQ